MFKWDQIAMVSKIFQDLLTLPNTKSGKSDTIENY